MPTNFPNSPTTGEIFSVNGREYEFDGVKWISTAQTANFIDASSPLVIIENDFEVQGDTTLNDLDVIGDTVLGEDATDDIIVNGVMSFSSSGRIGSNVLPETTGIYNIGNNGARFDVVYANVLNGVATEAKYADLAEKYESDKSYESGTVMVFGGEKEITISHSKNDSRIAGIVSTNPAYLMNSDLDAANTVSLALQGRVPCKVVGTAKKGDILVSSSRPGHAVAGVTPVFGSVIGKSLEDKHSEEPGIIEVVVGRL